jgi:uncharacterized protein (DUF427 family)
MPPAEPPGERELTRDERHARALWRWHGQQRPPFAVPPGAGQESVWDYPRPPRLAPDTREVIVMAGAVVVARTTRAVRVMETASPPTFYLPADDVDASCIVPYPGASLCEWKGRARYWSVVAAGHRLDGAAWSYPDPSPRMRAIQGHLAFYPGVLACFVAGERVLPQPGRFYAGWITAEIVGPFKGEPGSEGW